jgi:hypothetical protein
LLQHKPATHLRLLILLYLCRCLLRRDGSLRWLISPIQNEQDCLALIVRLSPGNESIQDMFIVPDIRGKVGFRLRSSDPWLQRGRQFHAYEEFVGCVGYVNGLKRQ